MPAAAPLADGWIPDADLRGARALPVLVVAGRDDAHLAAAIAALADDLADAEIVVEQQAPSGLEDFESRTVALCNRGVPSFAVETDGTLHTALMRSCTGWPSGIWIDDAAAHRARRLQLPIAALDARFRLCAGRPAAATGATPTFPSAAPSSLIRCCP